MELFVTVQQVGKRGALLERRQVAFSRPPGSLRELIAELVREEVARYQRKAVGEPAILLTDEEMNTLAERTGKVGFAARYDERNINEAQALEIACSAFRDGLFRVFWERSKEAEPTANSDSANSEAANSKATDSDAGNSAVELTELDAAWTPSDGDRLIFVRLTFLAGRMW